MSVRTGTIVECLRQRLAQTDEQEMGFSYADLERYLSQGPETVAPSPAMRIERLIRRREHKRALPPIPEIQP